MTLHILLGRHSAHTVVPSALLITLCSARTWMKQHLGFLQNAFMGMIYFPAMCCFKYFSVTYHVPGTVVRHYRHNLSSIL